MSTSLMSAFASYPNFTPFLANTITSAAQANGLSPTFLATQLAQESSFNPAASNGSAYGIAQFEPATAAQYGVDPTSVTSSVNGAAAYDAALLDQTGSLSGVLNAYGTGTNNYNNLANTLDLPTVQGNGSNILNWAQGQNATPTAESNAVAANPTGTTTNYWYSAIFFGILMLLGALVIYKEI